MNSISQSVKLDGHLGKFFRYYIFIPCVVVISSSCSSLVDRGDKLYEQGMYEQAASFYQKALSRDPNDVEAIIGLTKARNMVIDQGLIDVRMLRLGSNDSGATNKLEDILRKQNAWNIKILGAASITQEEETGYAQLWLRNEAKILSQSTYPDKFRWFMKSYAYLISNAQMEPQFDQYQPKLKDLGKKQCKSMVNDVHKQRFYLQSFVEKYCLAWGEGVAIEVDNVDKSRYHGLGFSQNVRFSTDDNSAQHSILRNQLSHLEEQFKNSLWYSSKGETPIAINVSGNVVYNKSMRQIRKSAKYTEQVKVKLENGAYRMKAVQRTYQYPVAVYNEKYNLHITYQANVNAQVLKHEITKVDGNRTEEHHSTFKPARLSPVSPGFIQLGATFESELADASNQIQRKLKLLWKDSYCKDGMGSQQGENILRCAKLAPDDVYVNRWFTQKFGVDYNAMVSLYGM
ncbi:MAG: tetratricopeptide repeat protein [Gammaproteobacteria bacterium]|nr:tetratricopeptide repeat protein [Gammaproteobacteria bacterium]